MTSTDTHRPMPRTVIRMGAAHFDVTVTSPNGDAQTVDLGKQLFLLGNKREVRSSFLRETSRVLCSAYGIGGDQKGTKRFRKRNRKRGNKVDYPPSVHMQSLPVVVVNDDPKAAIALDSAEFQTTREKYAYAGIDMAEDDLISREVADAHREQVTRQLSILSLAVASL